MLVFWKRGYERTSIQDLEGAMGLKRTSIYNAFGNKREIFQRVMACYKESVMAELFQACQIGRAYRIGDLRQEIHVEKLQLHITTRARQQTAQ